MKRAVIIFSGFNQRAVTAFVRTLEMNGVDFSFVAGSEADPIFLTKYRDKVGFVRKNKVLEVDDMISIFNAIKKKNRFDECILAPSVEYLNRFLSKNKAAFEKAGFRIPIVDIGLYELVSDKSQFGKLCAEAGIASPAEYPDESKINFPCVAKPKSYFASDGGIYTPVILRGKKDHAEFKKAYPYEDFYFQEFVGGDSLYLLYYFYRDGTFAKFSQQNFVQQPGGKSMIAAKSSDFHISKVSAEYESLFKSKNFFGLVMVEVKYYNGKYYMIEANPRFWGPSQLFVDAGANLFECWLYDEGLIGKKPDFKHAKSADYFWFGGVIESITSGGKLAFHTIDDKVFAENITEWMKADLYNRDDTREQFMDEAGL